MTTTPTNPAPAPASPAVRVTGEDLYHLHATSLEAHLAAFNAADPYEQDRHLAVGHHPPVVVLRGEPAADAHQFRHIISPHTRPSTRGAS